MTVYPYSDDYMTYNPATHRYTLTLKDVTVYLLEFTLSFIRTT